MEQHNEMEILTAVVFCYCLERSNSVLRLFSLHQVVAVHPREILSNGSEVPTVHLKEAPLSLCSNDLNL